MTRSPLTCRRSRHRDGGWYRHRGRRVPCWVKQNVVPTTGANAIIGAGIGMGAGVGVGVALGVGVAVGVGVGVGRSAIDCPIGANSLS